MAAGLLSCCKYIASSIKLSVPYQLYPSGGKLRLIGVSQRAGLVSLFQVFQEFHRSVHFLLLAQVSSYNCLFLKQLGLPDSGGKLRSINVDRTVHLSGFKFRSVQRL
jgi:hypothetical protein